ncbi:MAG: hypothetical protein WC291_08155 [Thermodesulfovibrionales bacterium]
MTLNDAAYIAQIVTGIGSLVVAGLAIRASRQISAQQQETALKTNRAYIVPHFAQVSLFTVGKPVELTLTARNWGQTPALRTRGTVRVYFADQMRGEPLEIEPEKSEIALPPQQGFQLDRVGKDTTPLTDQQFEQIKSGTLRLFCDFLVEYYDIAGGKHETSVRYFLDPKNLSQKPYPPLSIGKDSLSMS